MLFVDYDIKPLQKELASQAEEIDRLSRDNKKLEGKIAQLVSELLKRQNPPRDLPGGDKTGPDVGGPGAGSVPPGSSVPPGGKIWDPETIIGDPEPPPPPIFAHQF